MSFEESNSIGQPTQGGACAGLQLGHLKIHNYFQLHILKILSTVHAYKECLVSNMIEQFFPSFQGSYHLHQESYRFLCLAIVSLDTFMSGLMMPVCYWEEDEK